MAGMAEPDLLTAAELAEIEAGTGVIDSMDLPRAVATIRALAEALNAVLDGFEAGVFVRDVSLDHEPDWALRIAPYLAALAKAELLARRVLGASGKRG